MPRLLRWGLGSSLILLLSGHPAQAATILTFENVAQPCCPQPVHPWAPYHEDFFTLTPAWENAHVVDAAYPDTSMIGNDSDFFRVPGDNAVTLTSDGWFHLANFLIGPLSTSEMPPRMVVTGYFANGAVNTRVFDNITTSFIADLNWLDLTRVVFASNTDAGLDDIEVTRLPEPTSLLLLGTGLAAAGAILRRSNRWPSR